MQQIILVIGLYLLVMGAVYGYKYSTAKKDEIKAWYKKKLIRGGIITIVAVVVFFMLGMLGMFRNNFYGVGMGGSVPQMVSSSISIPAMDYSYKQTMYPGYYNNNNGNVSDTREYTKKTFTASMKTQAVEEIAKKVETLIKTVDGRIDSSNISEKYATFTFVIPKTNFDTFETQMRGFISKKLYSQTVTSQNLLSEKQSIEKNQNSAQESINATKKQKEQVEADYTTRINTLKSQIAAVKAQIAQLDASISRNESARNATTDQNTITTLERELNALSQTRKSYNQQVVNYNSEIENATTNFKSQMTYYGYSLESQNQVLTQLGVQEVGFLDKVETVQGSVSINYITLWQLLNIFSPVNLWIILGILLLVGRLYLLNKEEGKLNKINE